ncbi:phenylacetaldehyde reductase [Medicago truncatula]|uniref:phenylacetaldehyde reductase n=1 Tax=Medicago truncatula TaxID=3880 RepID=UPI001968797D|nr:phenylacetaldehyde reductase-like [Medicago truncatula]
MTLSFFSEIVLITESTQLIDPAVKGTLNVLKSCAKSPSVKRVVITSIASVVYNGRPRTPEVVVDETWFSNPDLLWEQKLDAGSETYRTAAFRWINVKDVANAHINAYEDASASGRYCLAERVMHFSELVTSALIQIPTSHIMIINMGGCADDKLFMQTFQVSKEKAKTLVIDFIPLEMSLKEIIESFKEKKFASMIFH